MFRKREFIIWGLGYLPTSLLRVPCPNFLKNVRVGVKALVLGDLGFRVSLIMQGSQIWIPERSHARSKDASLVISLIRCCIASFYNACDILAKRV